MSAGVIGIAVGQPEGARQRFYDRGRSFVYDSTDEDLTVYGAEDPETGEAEVIALFPQGCWTYAERVYQPLGVIADPQPLGPVVSRGGRP